MCTAACEGAVLSTLFPHLFTPLKLGHLTLKNRICFGTHTPNMSIEGRAGDPHFAYYLERARGGVAMISVEPVPAHETGMLTRGQFDLASSDSIASFRRIVDACHGEGVVTVQQVFHIGPHCDPDRSFAPNWSASGTVSLKDGGGGHAMSEPEIEEAIEGFVKSARIIRECGFDGVEINAGYQALIDSFWAPLTNRRTDRWGGSLENRMRFSVEILSRIRKAVGNDFLIGLTMTGDDNMPGGQTVDDRMELVAYLDERGLFDYMPIKTGSYYDWTRVMPTFFYDEMQGPPLAAKIKSVVRHGRIQAESRVKTPANAERTIASGWADMISIVRGQIADPHLANKAAADRPEDIRVCISCNQLCVGRRMRDYWLSCLANPTVGRESDWRPDDPVPAETPRKVLIVGAGPGGLEAARIAALRGHSVTVLEREDYIGGQFRLAATQPKRGEIAQLLNVYYRSQLEKLGVDLQLNVEADVDTVRRFGADTVIVATGSRPPMTGVQKALPGVQRLPGVDGPNVYSINAVLRGEEGIGPRVLLLDDLNGWLPASGTAAFLGQRGHRVTVVTSAPALGLALGHSTADGPLRKYLSALDAEAVTDTALISWDGSGAVLRNLLDGKEQHRAFDALVLATPNVPETALANALQNDGMDVHAIGDCVAARTAAMAIYEGAKVGRAL